MITFDHIYGGPLGHALAAGLAAPLLFAAADLYDTAARTRWPYRVLVADFARRVWWWYAPAWLVAAAVWAAGM